MRRPVVTGTLLFGAAVAALLFLRLLPFSAGAVGLPGPDLALCLALVWVLRRPDQLAAPVIALAFLLQDIVLFQPLGLWPAIVLMGTEAARRNEARWRDQPFMVEWLRAGVLTGLMMLAYRIVQVLFMMPVPALGQVILHYLATIAAYPAAVLAAQALFGVRHPMPLDREMRGTAR